MKKIFIFCLVLILTVPSLSFARWGKGEVKLDKYSMEHFLMYLYGAGDSKLGFGKAKNKPTMFILAEDGKMSWYSYCPIQYECDPSQSLQGKMIRSCEKKSNGAKCYVFALKRRVVWKHGGPKVSIKKKDLKSPYKVAKIIQDAGLYDGDITKLAGIDVTTGKTDDEIDITGQKKDPAKDKSSDDTDIVKQLEDLKELYESGSLTKKEFDKAKKKLLAN